MDRDNVKTGILNIKRVAFENGVVNYCEPTRQISFDRSSSISKPKDIVPVESISRYKFAPSKIEINQSTQPNLRSNTSRHEDAGGAFAARYNENYNYYTESSQGPLTLLSPEVRLTVREVNQVKINLKISEIISEEAEIEESHEKIRIEEPDEEVEIEERDDIVNNQIIEPTVTKKLPKPSCCIFSCSCLKKMFSRKSAKVGVSNKNLSASLAIAIDLSEAQTDREKDDNDREEITV